MTSPLTGEEFARVMSPLESLPAIALAVSGGSDSLAMMLLATQWRDERLRQQKSAPEIFVLSVNHGMRLAASNETESVARMSKQLGCQVEILKIQSPPPRRNKQAALREHRYGLLCRWCQEHGVTTLLLAHQLEDQAETFLLRLARGSGVDGLSGMARETIREGVRLYRPLLDVPRARLQATLQQAGMPWVDDPSNQDATYARTRMRALLEPLAREGMDARRLARTAAQMARARIALEESASAHLQQHASLMEAGYATFEPDLLEANDEIVLRSISRLLMAVGGSVYPPRLSNLEELVENLRHPADMRGRTLSGCKIFYQSSRESNAGRFFVIREPQAALQAPALRLLPAQTTMTGCGVWDGRFQIFASHNGDQALEIRALGKEGALQCKPSADISYPAQIRYALPALWREDRLLGAPHLGVSPDFPLQMILARPSGLEAAQSFTKK